MRRCLIGIVAFSMVAGVALASPNADVTLVGGGTSIGPLDKDDTFNIQLYVDPDGSTATNFDNWAISAESKIRIDRVGGGSATGILDLTGPALTSESYNFSTWERTEAKFALPIPVGDVDPITTGAIGSAARDGQYTYFGTGGTYYVVYSRVLLATLNFKIDAAAVLTGATYEISADGVYFSMLTDGEGNFSTVQGVSGTNKITVTTVPEPASALLLLGAIPFLRRRR